MTLREQVAQDNQHLFFNPDEFGSEHILEGRKITALLDVDQSQAGKFAVAFGDLAYCTLYALESDLVGLTLREGKELALDKKIYLIRQVSHEDGIVLLTLTARRGY